MAFQSKSLSVLAYANGFTLWHYTTIDLATDVDTIGYFNAGADMLRIGDMIFANVDTDGIPQAGIYLITANSAGVVDAADMTQIGATNLD